MIGIILRKSKTNTNKNVFVLYEDIHRILNNYNLKIVLINPLDIDYDLIDKCKGLLLQGGTNFYNEELKIIKKFYDDNKPVLGICLGMQEMNMFLGGNLKKISNHNKSSLYVHNVYIDKDSLFYKIIKKDNILVNSRHSYAVNKTVCNVVGISKDGVIEVIEDKNKKFFIGVQFHPESILDDKVTKKIFDYFYKCIKK